MSRVPSTHTRILVLAGIGLALCLGFGFALAGGTPPEHGEGSAEQATTSKPAYEMPRKTKRSWPHGEWASAKAYTFNFVPMGPGFSLYVYREGTWNQHIESTHELTRDQAELAFELVHRTRGGVDISKCPFPRHAVVFFDESGEPLGSVNVCFECGDILVWPLYYGDRDEEWKKYDIPGAKTRKKKRSRKAEDDELPDQRIFQVYSEVMPQWRTFFEKLGVPLSIDEQP